MSQSKANLVMVKSRLERDLGASQRQVVELLRYIGALQEEHPDIEWPPIPGQYSEGTWRHVL